MNLEKKVDQKMQYSSSSESQGPDAGIAKIEGACSQELKLGDTCDSCYRGIMLPPGGVEYYEKELKEYGFARHAKAHEKIICNKCAHWHVSIGQSCKSGFDRPV
jgi:hypothetical protein